MTKLCTIVSAKLHRARLHRLCQTASVLRAGIAMRFSRGSENSFICLSYSDLGTNRGDFQARQMALYKASQIAIYNTISKERTPSSRKFSDWIASAKLHRLLASISMQFGRDYRTGKYSIQSHFYQYVIGKSVN